MVAVRPLVTSTLVSCCCPGSYNKASWRYPDAANFRARTLAGEHLGSVDEGPRQGAGSVRGEEHGDIRDLGQPRGALEQPHFVQVAEDSLERRVVNLHALIHRGDR